ncbi:hypothetical protein C1645_832990 [Glomus cerebriforme]|uniref:Uncharacterized protein n=1 Tax=Glomus cerebriforme TaxID=658196 RepID=A0A397SMX8_9GLOM|nr:hypothetical protein C1645_832990 [Glomus cerebriforme]
MIKLQSLNKIHQVKKYVNCQDKNKIKCSRHSKITHPYVSIPKLCVRAVNKSQYDENEKSSISEYNDIEGITFENEVIDDNNDDDTDNDDDDDQLLYKSLLRTLQVNDDDNDEPLFDNIEDILEEESSDFRDFNATFAYEDLAKILTHLEFQMKNVPTNIHQICK